MKNTPEAPSISNEREYIEWFVQYSDKLVELRNLAGRYAKGVRLKDFVAEHSDRGMSLLEMHPDRDSLFERVSKGCWQNMVGWQIALNPRGSYWSGW